MANEHKISNAQGEAIIALLELPRGEWGRVDTIIGDKTAVGLALTIQRIFNEPVFARRLVAERKAS